MNVACRIRTHDADWWLVRPLLTALLSTTTSCVAPFEPPSGTYRFVPSARYHDLWARVSDCAGLTGDIRKVEWNVVPGDFFQCGDQACEGLWVAPHSIFLAESTVNDSLTGYFTVRHEILHELVRKAGHPSVFVKCGLLLTVGGG